MIAEPRLDECYRAGDLPPGSVVRSTTTREYVIGRRGRCMLWEQPIPGSQDWRVAFTGRLAPGEWLTPRQRAEVDEAGRDVFFRTACAIARAHETARQAAHN